MNITAATRQVVELARSVHTDAGRYALADNAPVDNSFIALKSSRTNLLRIGSVPAAHPANDLETTLASGVA